jgi:hypothetical protein
MNSLKDAVAVAKGCHACDFGGERDTGSIIANSRLSEGKKVRVVGRNAGRLQRFVRQGAEAFTATVSDAAALIKPSAVRARHI